MCNTNDYSNEFLEYIGFRTNGTGKLPEEAPDKESENGEEDER